MRLNSNKLRIYVKNFFSLTSQVILIIIIILGVFRGINQNLFPKRGFEEFCRDILDKESQQNLNKKNKIILCKLSQQNLNNAHIFALIGFLTFSMLLEGWSLIVSLEDQVVFLEDEGKELD